MPLSMWENLSKQMNGEETNMYIRILAQDRSNLTELSRIETEVSQVLEQNYNIESENRIQEKRSNDEMIQGSQIILGSFCGLLAVIGIANVFSNTLGFLRQRKREFAQYLSIGFTPANMKKMFYPAVFHRAEEGGYWITFPDIPECITEGDNMEEAYNMAVDALGLALTDRIKEKQDLPKASEVDDIKEDGTVVVVQFDLAEYNRKHNNRAVKKH